MATKELDILIIGAGPAGTVLASRLHASHPELHILLVEAGPDIAGHPLSKDPAMLLQFSEWDWGYNTVPQKSLDGRVCAAAAGKVVGGGTSINAGEFAVAFSMFQRNARGDKADLEDLRWLV